MIATLKREVAVTDRAMEFFTEKELTVRMGGGKEHWPSILLKELVDNSLDAAEGIRSPVIEVTIHDDGFTVADNGPGLDTYTLKESWNYSVLVSDKSMHVTPTRGQMGNGLKCVWAAPFVANGSQDATVTVETQGRKYTIRVSADQIRGVPSINHDIQEGLPVKIGTSVTVKWSEKAGFQRQKKIGVFYHRLLDFAILNPSACFRLMCGKQAWEIGPTDTSWRKWLKGSSPPPHWYNLDRFRSLIASKLASLPAGSRSQPIRDFIADNFCGLSSTVVRGQLLRSCGLDGSLLECLVSDGLFDDAILADLLGSMKKHARPVKPEALGMIGRGNLKIALVNHAEVSPSSFKYDKSIVEEDGVPYVLEVAFGFAQSKAIPSRLIVTGVNWSPTLRPPFAKLDHHLGCNRVNDEDPCAIIVHLACPRPQFEDAGKKTLSLPDRVQSALKELVGKVTEPWKKLKQKAERENSLREKLNVREIQDALRQKKSGFISIKEACLQVIEQAYKDASGKGERPANARQVMYAARRLVLQNGLTDPESGKDGFYKRSASFTQVLLPDFIKKHPDLTKNWDVVFDDRGHFAEPHTGRRLGIGTLAVRDYMAQWRGDLSGDQLSISLPKEIVTCGPSNRYRFVLFIEKEGFDALLASAHIQERFDIALMSTKGMSVTAARQLVEKLSQQGVTVLVLHDFDKSGLSILHTLRSNTRRYNYDSKPNVIDIGLRLEDVVSLELKGERVTYESDASPKRSLRESGATNAECEYLVSGGGPGRWEGRRVELNELTSPQFIKYLEGKLTDALVSKVVPESAALSIAFQRQVRLSKLQAVLDAAAKDVVKEVAKEPPGLRERLEDMIKGKSTPWDLALWQLVSEAQTLSPGRPE